MKQTDLHPALHTPYVTPLAGALLSGAALAGNSPAAPSLKRIREKAAERKMDQASRKNLVSILLNQYQADGISPDSNSKVFRNIRALESANTFTFTTGQQIHIFLGPLFFIYKIESLLALTSLFNHEQSEQQVVPVFWMASEDHDLDEINHVKLYGDLYRWDAKPGNAVGRMDCEGLPELLNQLEERADKNETNLRFFGLLRKHYQPGRSLSAATRTILHELFEDSGLIVINPDDSALKSIYAPVLFREIGEKVLYTHTRASLQLLKKDGFEPRVNPQAINYFWLTDQKRIKLRVEGNHIVREDNQTPVSESELKKHPEQISPNVLARPIYQECILPNLLYLGGSAELEYWLPLQSAFAHLGLSYPVLAHRDSALMLSARNLEFIKQCGFAWHELFQPEGVIAEQYSEKRQADGFTASRQIHGIEAAMQQLKKELEQRNMPGAIFSECNESIKSLRKLEKLLFEEELKQQKSDRQLEKLLKIKVRFFDVRQEREEFVVGHPHLTRFPLQAAENLMPMLHLNTL